MLFESALDMFLKKSLIMFKAMFACPVKLADRQRLWAAYTRPRMPS